MEGGALVADFSPLQWTIGRFLFLHSARQCQSGHMQILLFLLFSYFWHTFVYLLI